MNAAASPPHLLVLALFRREPLQHAAVPDNGEILPQRALVCGDGAASGPASVGAGAGSPVVVGAGFADVPANGLPPDLLGDDGGAVRLVQRFYRRGGI